MAFFDELCGLLRLHLFSLAGADFSIGSLLGMLISLYLLILVAHWLRRRALRSLLAHGHLDISTRETASFLTYYIVLATGVVLILDGTGIKLSSFTVLAGALGVGVGFGLQNIFSNFISGLIVMLERPVKIGDHIVVAGAEGDVVEIGLRATTLVTAQGSLVIVPNQSFITGNVINWDRSSNSVAVIQLHMTGQARENQTMLLELMHGNPDILQQPEPAVFVAAVDHAGQTMELHFWLAGDAQQRLKVISNFNSALLDELARRGWSLAS